MCEADGRVACFPMDVRKHATSRGTFGVKKGRLKDVLKTEITNLVLFRERVSLTETSR